MTLIVKVADAREGLLFWQFIAFLTDLVRHGAARMTDAEVYEKLTSLFRDIFDDDEITLRPEMTADDVPEWDSMRTSGSS